MATLSMHRYALQPGDGTLYNFYIVPFCTPPMALCVEAETGEITAPVPLYELVAGVGTWQEAEEDFVTLGVCMSTSQGSYEVSKNSLQDPHREFILYLSSYMPYVDRYTLAAVVLAASVLVDRPTALEEAASAMLRAPELL